MNTWLGLFIFLVIDLLAFVVVRRPANAPSTSDTEQTAQTALPLMRLATDLLGGIALLLLAALLWKLWRLVS